MAGKRLQVVQALAQRGHVKREDGEAVVEVEAEGAIDNALLEVAVRGGDHADVDAHNLVVADALDLAALKKAEEFGLNSEREFADLVEEERAPVRRLDAADAGLDGSGEGAAGVPEEFGFKQSLGDCGAVEHGEGL
jgi:hypothetical protein